MKEAEAAFKEAFKLHNPSRAGVAIWRMYAHMKQVISHTLFNPTAQQTDLPIMIYEKKL